MNGKLLNEAITELTINESAELLSGDLKTMFGCVIASKAFEDLPDSEKLDLWNAYNDMQGFLTKVSRAA